MRVLLDVNILVDSLTGRLPFGADAQNLWRRVEAGQVEAVVAATTVTTVFYLIDKLIDNATAQRAVADLLAQCEVRSVDHSLLTIALAKGWPDFEDAVQDTAAEAARISTIVTRDPGGFTGSACRIMDAATLVNELDAASP